jgi:hypothetical protein
MSKIFRPFAITLFLGFIVIQFFQPDKNKTEHTKNHLFEQENVPPPIKEMLANACFDCHSNNTNYLWYHNISPVSWMINEHIQEGKNELNFSTWRDMDVYKKITMLEEMCQETERKKMPLKSYRVMHSKAKLSDEQIASFCEWTTQLSEELLAKATEK